MKAKTRINKISNSNTMLTSKFKQIERDIILLQKNQQTMEKGIITKRICKFYKWPAYIWSFHNVKTTYR